MKLLILSDTHFGFDEGGERWADPFECVEQAVGAEKDADAILLVGDVFDSRVASPETLGRALAIFEGIRKSGVPVVAIHGTHERRAKEFANPLQVMGQAGLLTYLHCSSCRLAGEEKVVVYGMGGIPDQYAGPAFTQWNPRPESGMFNILLFHQSLEGFLYAQNLLRPEELPPGFDLYINGHIHEARLAEHQGKPLLISGSAIPTQFTPDAVKPRGYWVVEVNEGRGRYTFREYPRQRLYVQVEGSGEEIGQTLAELAGRQLEKKPVVRVVLAKGQQLDAGRYTDRLIVITKTPEEVVQEQAGVTLAEHRLSVQEQGKKFLLEGLEKAGLNPRLYEEVFELLEEGRMEEARKRVVEGVKGKV